MLVAEVETVLTRRDSLRHRLELGPTGPTKLRRRNVRRAALAAMSLPFLRHSYFDLYVIDGSFRKPSI